MSKHLQKRLNELEYKPSDSLWNHIEQQVNGGFEASLEKRLRKFEAVPDPALWEKIEAELPINPVPSKAGYGTLILFAILFLSSVSGMVYFILDYKQHTIKDKDNLKTSSLNTNVNPEKFSPVHSLTKTTLNSQNDRTDLPSAHSQESQHAISIKKQYALQELVATNRLTPPKKEHPNTGRIAHVNPSNSEQNSDVESRASHHIVAVKSSAPKSVQSIIGSGEVLTTLPLSDSKELSTELLVKNNESKFVSSNTKEPLPVSESQISTPPVAISDSVLVSFNKTEEKRTESGSAEMNEEPGNFSLSVITSMNYCFSILSAPSGTGNKFDQNITLRRTIEIPSVDWSGSFLMDYRINDRWRISGGIGILNFSQEFNYNTTTPVVINSFNESRAVVMNPNDSIIDGKSMSTRIKYSWTEIPLFLAYQLTNHTKWNVELQGGISYAILSTTDAGMVNYDNKGVLLIRDKNAFPGLTNSVFITLNPALTWALNNTVTLSIMPTAKASLNSMISNDAWVKQYPIFVGLSAGLRKRF